MMRRSVFARADVCTATVANPQHRWAVAPTVDLPETWHHRLDEVSYARSLDSKLWIARDHLWPFFGVPNLRSLRNPRLALDDSLRNVVLPIGDALLTPGSPPPITPLWTLSPGERKRLLRDFPLPSPPYKPAKRYGAAEDSISESHQDPASPADAAKGDPISRLVGACAHGDSTHTASASEFRGPRATPTEMLLLRDGVGWVPMPAALAPLASLVALPPEQQYDWLHDVTAGPTRSGHNNKASVASLLAKPDVLLFLEGDFAPTPWPVPSHVALHNVQELPRTSAALELEPTLSHSTVRRSFSRASGTPCVVKSRFRLDPEAELALNAARDQHRCESFRWTFESSIRDIGSVRPPLPPDAVAPTVGSEASTFVGGGGSGAVVDERGLWVANVATTEFSEALPLASLPATARKYFLKTTPGYALKPFDEGKSSRSMASPPVAILRMHQKYARVLFLSNFEHFEKEAEGRSEPPVSAVSDVITATRLAIPEEGGLVFVRLRDITGNALIARDPEVAEMLAQVRAGTRPVFRLPCHNNTRLVNMDCVAPRSPPPTAAATAAVATNEAGSATATAPHPDPIAAPELTEATARRDSAMLPNGAPSAEFDADEPFAEPHMDRSAAPRAATTATTDTPSLMTTESQVPTADVGPETGAGPQANSTVADEEPAFDEPSLVDEAPPRRAGGDGALGGGAAAFAVDNPDYDPHAHAPAASTPRVQHPVDPAAPPAASVAASTDDEPSFDDNVQPPAPPATAPAQHQTVNRRVQEAVPPPASPQASVNAAATLPRDEKDAKIEELERQIAALRLQRAEVEAIAATPRRHQRASTTRDVPAAAPAAARASAGTPHTPQRSHTRYNSAPPQHAVEVDIGDEPSF